MNPEPINPRSQFRGGPNIALKLPPGTFDATVAFYRDTLLLPTIGEHRPAVVFQFGHCQLWLDRTENLSRAEIWLQILTDDTSAAAEHLTARSVTRCDELEALPAGFDGFWIRSPASTVHLVSIH